jgi:hypothetical protein
MHVLVDHRALLMLVFALKIGVLFSHKGAPPLRNRD